VDIFFLDKVMTKNKHVLMPVLNLDRVLLANSDTCHLVSSKPHISSCFFKNNTCFTFPNLLYLFTSLGY
jgi:hypothetical protein